MARVQRNWGHSNSNKKTLSWGGGDEGAFLSKRQNNQLPAVAGWPLSVGRQALAVAVAKFWQVAAKRRCLTSQPPSVDEPLMRCHSAFFF